MDKFAKSSWPQPQAIDGTFASCCCESQVRKILFFYTKMIAPITSHRIVNRQRKLTVKRQNEKKSSHFSNSLVLLPSRNIMHDSRVVRGSNYSQQHRPQVSLSFFSFVSTFFVIFDLKFFSRRWQHKEQKSLNSPSDNRRVGINSQRRNDDVK